MLYLTGTFWAIVVVVSAWGVHALWSAMIKPRVVNMILLPGTLVAQMGHVLGLLITGGTVHDTTLIGDDDAAAPRRTESTSTRLPVIGPLIVGLLPIASCAVALVVAAVYLGRRSTLRQLIRLEVATELPLSLGGFWDLLHAQLNLMETTLAAILRSNAADWQAWLFVYLLICLTVRMAPFPGQLRGSLVAIVVVGLLAGLVSLLFDPTRTFVERIWVVLSLCVCVLLLLLVFSLIVYGLVGLVRLMAPRPGRAERRPVRTRAASTA